MAAFMHVYEYAYCFLFACSSFPYLSKENGTGAKERAKQEMRGSNRRKNV